MSADHERFADWDAAYLLGSLSAADRSAYEAHLAHCARCRAAIGEVAPTLGLLARVAPERAVSLLSTADDEAPEPEHRARVLSLAAERARRRRRAWIIGAAAAVVVAVAVPLSMALLRPAPETFALEQVVDAPLTATVSLSDVAWGTRIDMTCAYGRAEDAPADGWPYALVVVADDGTESVLSTWRARPDTTAQLSAGTDLPTTEIAAIEIRGVLSGDVLMRTEVDSSAGR
ncbi:zf-HC2 domain-containing protein [Streptomyces sp. AC495_CC817]|uniref:zf-HC2 domain-containing protein n=1 Tax=Streptomyces sp. AC495_CC817 TaxID=2823900 RepID=UPI001C270CD7|nr:zf-HC2 domain-containing protein [Streptomyces sp. AC495_CC817]